MKHYCNPLNIEYRYQFKREADPEGKKKTFPVFREAADPTLILHKGEYFLFPSMAGGFYTSPDLMDWTFWPFGPEIPVYDYAPDVQAVGDYLYFSASAANRNCSLYRTRDPRTEPFEQLPEMFPFWDPNLFADDDGRVYLYWGSSNVEPIYGIELDAETMMPIGEKKGLISADEATRGFERSGPDHIAPKTPEMIEAEVENVLAYAMMQAKEAHIEDQIDVEAMRANFREMFGNRPYLEGVYMNKHDGKYYLQYAFPGTQYNVYGDAVFVSDSPLGDFVPAKNNPFSYHPEGFVTGPGHGSTLVDKDGVVRHIASLRIAHCEKFERRIGLWTCGFDEEGELFCDQRYADWPLRLDAAPFEKPDYMLLSYGADVTASSGTNPECAVDEDIHSLWKASADDPNPWIAVDLGAVQNVSAVQINFGDDGLELELPKGETALLSYVEERWIDMRHQVTRWKLEGSADGETYELLCDKSEAETDLSHDLVEFEAPKALRYLRLQVVELPYGQTAAVSGLRAFGRGSGEAPAKAADVKAILDGDLDMDVSWIAEDASGANILWGYAPDKLYHSVMVHGRNARRIAALIKDQPVYARVDVYNANGITEGDPVKVR